MVIVWGEISQQMKKIMQQTNPTKITKFIPNKYLKSHLFAKFQKASSFKSVMNNEDKEISVEIISEIVQSLKVLQSF